MNTIKQYLEEYSTPWDGGNYESPFDGISNSDGSPIMAALGGAAVLGVIYKIYKSVKGQTGNEEAAKAKALQAAMMARQIAIKNNNPTNIKKAEKAIVMLKKN